MRVAILGNSGSGKSTLAGWLASRTGAVRLDLDTIAWERGTIAVARSPEAAKADVRTFCSSCERWVLEGCYASLVQAALEFSPLLLFLNPGVDQCVENCRARPWEMHKYSSKEEQDARLAFLLAWVRDYYSRDGDMSLIGHRACFDEYDGPKKELGSQCEPEALWAELAVFSSEELPSRSSSRP
jgi:adenylate kinase family enzyme